MKENWKDIKGYEGIYQVSDKGRIKSLNWNKTGKKKLLKIHVSKKHGYSEVHLSKEGKDEVPRVHRLVAQAFIPNPDNLPQVNHKDEDKTNNNVDNLEWCTAKYNTNYGTGKQRRAEKRKNSDKRRKPIAQFTFDLPCELVKVWPSLREIERQLGFAHANIVKCCKGKCEQAYGYQWAYWKE